GDLTAAVLAVAGHVDLEGRAAVRTRAGRVLVFGDAAPSNEGPVLAEAARAAAGAADDTALRVDGVVAHMGVDAGGQRVVEGIALHLHGQDLFDLHLFEEVAQVLLPVRLDPVLVHLEDIVRLVGPRLIPAKG